MPLVLVAIPAELIFAVAILLMLWATAWIFQKPLAKLLSLIPVIGGNAAQAVTTAGGWIVDSAASWAKIAVDPVVQLWNVSVNAVGGFIGQVSATVEAVWNNLNTAAQALWATVTHLDALAAQLAGRLASVAASLASQAATLAATVDRVARIISVSLPGLADSLRSWAAARIASAVDGLELALARTDRALRALIAGAIDTYTVRLGQAIDGVRAWAGQLVAEAVGPLARAIDGLRAEVDTRLRGLSGQVGQLTGALAPLLALDLATTLPQLLTRIKVMEDECVNPTCAAIKPRLDLLNLLSDGLMLGLMLELVHEAIHDPEGAAHTAAAGADELRSLTDELVGPILGVRV